MNNQEMQFADPEWRPSQRGNRNNDLREQEPYIPQPINTDPREQAQWHATPEQEAAYAGAAPHTDFGAEKISGDQLRQRPRRRGGPWLWIILAILAFAILGSLASPSFQFRGHGVQDLDARIFSVGTHPTIVINDNVGTINVHAGNSDTVTINPTQENSGFRGDSDTTVNYNQSSDGNTITVNVEGNGFGFFDPRSVNLDVTVPSNTNLQVKTDTGEIDVTGVNGQMSLTSETGSINATQDSLSGQSILKTDTGSVTFNGSIDPNGTYQFESNTGSVDVTLPSNSSFHVDAITDTGSINSDFPGVNVQHSDVTGTSAHNDVGSPPHAALTLKTDTGSINLNTP